MIYQITDAGVRTGKNFKDFNNKYHILLEESECTPCGGDFVVYCNNQDLDFLQDNIHGYAISSLLNIADII